MSSPVYLTESDVRARFGNRSRSWLWRKLRDDKTFPQPTSLGTGRRYFRLAEIERWERRVTKLALPPVPKQLQRRHAA